MIALDTNVVVRLLIGDHDEQTTSAKRWVKANSGTGNPLFLPDIVLAETVWVLSSTYRLARSDIFNALMQLFVNTVFEFESDDATLFSLLETYATGKADFADILIANRARRAGCKTVMSFDKLAAKAGLMTEIAA